MMKIKLAAITNGLFFSTVWQTFELAQTVW
jgi:hypothetical protein